MSTIVFPGQGAQHRGMGAKLFTEFHELCAVADDILGYSIKNLCLEDKENCLNLTQFTQPALYTVNTFHYLHHLKEHPKPKFLAGHSLGEYNALLAAGVFDFETGLKLVQKRGQLMSGAQNGGMLALIRTNQGLVEKVLSDNQLDSIDVANYNSPSQLVLSGRAADITLAKKVFDNEKIFCIPLKVSGAFHSRQMKSAAEEYQRFLAGFEFSSIKIPVIANITGLPYQADQIKNMLIKQLYSSVQWTDTIRYLMAVEQVDLIEVGPGRVLTKLNNEIIESSDPIVLNNKNVQGIKSKAELIKPVDLKGLGSQSFLKHHQVKYPYVAGSMCDGISSEKLVTKMAQSGFLAFLGTDGLSVKEIEDLIKSCVATLKPEQSYGVNVHCRPGNSTEQKQLIDLCLKHRVPCIEISGFDQISFDLIKYRTKGLSRSGDQISIKNKILLKTAKTETAALFMQPAPVHILDKLLSEQCITPDEHLMAQTVPVVDDICVEGDAAWKTEQTSTLIKLPEIIRLREQRRSSLSNAVRIGCSGGVGTPEAIAAVFMLGADFVLTGSINQCTVEANTGDSIKQMLSTLSSEDTCCVPAGDLFESGARAQVVRKGVYFPARAQKLYDLYRLHDGLGDISAQNKQQLEKHFFHRSFESIFQELVDTEDSEEIRKANESSKYKMAKVFKWYFERAKKLPLNGKDQDPDNYQIYCGPALGAFNQWAADTPYEQWQNRHVDKMALSLLSAAVDFLKSQTEAA